MGIIAYYRVSTKRQEKSGLGLSAQQQMAEVYAEQYAGSQGILATYTEAESGKNCDRPEIAKAIAHAKSSKSILFIACLDRLARNVHFISGLMESGVEFVCGDCPTATRFTIHILAAVAEEEGRRISERTRKGLEQAKKKGVKLGAQNAKWREKRIGNPGLEKAQKVSKIKRMESAKLFYGFLMPNIQGMREIGKPLKQIAEELNKSGHLTRALKPYTAQKVCELLKKYGN